MAIACAVAAVIVLMPSLVMAQGQGKPPAAYQAEEPGFFATIGRWFDRQTASFSATFKEAGQRFENFRHEAGIAARTTVDGAKDAAGAVARWPHARVVTGHAQCRLAANGAPDCVSAAEAVCKTEGFASGASLDMTTAEVCPPKVWMEGRSTGEGCHTETFVSRALCQ